MSEERGVTKAEDIAKGRNKFLVDNNVNVGEGKWQGIDGKRQSRVKPDDYLHDGSGHGMGMPNVRGKSHVHFEFLKSTDNGNFNVSKNIHVPLYIRRIYENF